jgi:hypothetical protein
MSDSGKQSPLGVNSLSGLLQNTGIGINSPTSSIMGSSTSISNYTYGTIISTTVLNNLTNAIRQGYVRYNAGDLSLGTYTNLLAIGSATIPALGNSPPSTYSGSQSYNFAYTGQNASYGYYRLFAWQAYNEYNYNSSLPNYTDFLGSFQQASSYISQSNQAIMTLTNSLEFLTGTYSNMNDLTTADITGVSLATTDFGQDLINLGKALDLKTISTFGLPSNLLATIKNVNGLTTSLRIALLASGLSVSDVDRATSNNNVTPNQQQMIYGAFLIIAGVDLDEILISLNCKTTGLETLADLLNPKKMFPISYLTLTVPVYNVGQTQSTNSKTYYPIYTSSGSLNSGLTAPAIKSQIGSTSPAGTAQVSYTGYSSINNIQVIPQGFGSYLQDLLPADIAVAAGAFSVSMQQIKNITNIPIEKFAQVAANLETTQGLDLINGTNVPTDTTLAQTSLTAIALGSGASNTYTYSDFFGSMSGLPYPWELMQSLILSIQTPTLATIYANLYTATQGSSVGLDAAVQAQIDLANAEIATIKNVSSIQATQLNSLYSQTATQLNIEQRARNTGLSTLPDPRTGTIYPYPTIIYSFVDSVPSYALDTQPNMAAQTLEAISDLTNTTGQSIVGMMRENRNQSRLNLVGIPLDNNIPDTVPLNAADAAPAYPADTTTIVAPNPIVIPGSLAEPVNIIPIPLNTIDNSSVLLPSVPSIAQAINDVITCNCDCWVQ